MRCGIQAERVDEPASNDRITDRIVESSRKAEHVIAYLTNQKPNAHGSPIFFRVSKITTY
jgi:hypothetical protein